MKTIKSLELPTRQQFFRFLGYIDIKGPDECWPWLGHIEERGYGAFKYNGRMIKAHRLMLCIFKGGPPLDKPLAKHSCDNKKCCNHGHLDWGTNSENKLEFYQRGDTTKQKAWKAQGVKNGHAKLSNDDIAAIRDFLDDDYNQYTIAELFNVNQSVISRIKSGFAWSHI